ncbi:MAG TPA: cbb3-type cytochrome c oxidase subunit I [Bacteroidia bacterium]|nr:cbb3-type cytochrome c oxidase subunit I [Bacteroidia bacterium]MBP7713769.1 cbb3-type cytochrome c oxidase subunit I [Bacteroidia bacterium]MBP8667977.1 cbb3-type cytochrome c oxidase subunit I [Bacteroidia bacterium]HOZ81349.1 cbb3-type cytochrome c oxidase subunit I [Bacteroidia bacterium]HOZ89815.1 cbb3-type cytochrome c oxidase subunit I [Bacteroidia bacterium]
MEVKQTAGVAVEHHDDHTHEHDHHETFLTKYIFSQDHKTIAKQYLITAIIMAFFGMYMSLIFRLQLGFPETKFAFLESLIGKWGKGGRLDPGFYMALVTIHGTIMVFFVLTGGLSGTFSNLLIPLQVGARDMASGFLNMLSFWFFFLSCAVMTYSVYIETGPAAGGWTVYPPLSALPQAMPGSGLGMTLWLVSMVFFIIQSLLGGINYICTVINLRTKGMSMTRLPLTVWAFFITAILGVLTFPVLFAAALLLVFDRSFGTSFYLSDIFIGGVALPQSGGSPVLYEHLFWFLGHPEVYIIILPAFGLTSEVLSTMGRKPIFGYKAMVGSLMAIAFLSCIVWGHHMFVTGMNPFLGAVFTFTTLLVAIPSAVKVFNYLATLWRAKIQLTPAMCFAIGLVSLFISGGLTGIILGDSALDINVHDTYFVVAHFHVVMGASAIFGMLAGVYHWFPRMFGRMMNKTLGYVHFWITLIAVYGVFFPMHFIGLGGVPRRYYSNSAYEGFDVFLNINTLITVFAFLAAVAQVIFLFNFVYSIFKGKKAPQNPWHSNTLEWTSPAGPGIHGNWNGPVPTVHRWPYDYSKPGADDDYIPQTVPYSQTKNSNLPGEE